MLLEFLNQEDLVDILAREPIWRGQHDPVAFGQPGTGTQLIQPWTIQGRPTPL
jgi:hypothetical protein